MLRSRGRPPSEQLRVFAGRPGRRLLHMSWCVTSMLPPPEGLLAANGLGRRATRCRQNPGVAADG